MVDFFQPYMRTKKFRLLAVFLEATMLSVEDAQVEFELSIGKRNSDGSIVAVRTFV